MKLEELDDEAIPFHEASDDEADKNSRTVFAYLLPANATKYNVLKYFLYAGRVKNLTWSLDYGRRSRCYAYALVEFFDVTSVPRALELPNFLLLADQVIHVIPVEGEKEFVQFNGSYGESTSRAGSEGAVARMFYITNLDPNLDPKATETELEELFGYFGCVDFVMVHAEPGRPAKVQFAAPMLVEEIVKGKLLNLRNQEIKVSNRDPEADNQDGAIIQLDSRRTYGCSFDKLSPEYKESNGFVIEELEDASYYYLNMRDGFSLVTSPRPKHGELMATSDASGSKHQFGYGGTVRDRAGKKLLIMYGNIIDSHKSIQYREAVGVLRLLVNIDEKLLRLYPYLKLICDNKGVIDLLNGTITTRNRRLAEVIKGIKAEAGKKYGSGQTSRIKYVWSCRETGFSADRTSHLGLELKPNQEIVDNMCQDWTLQEFCRRRTYCKNSGNRKRKRMDGNTNHLPIPQVPNFLPFVISNSSRYLLLKNVFRRASEDVLDFDHIKSNVLTRCSDFGVVQRCYVYKRSAGHICLEFRRVQDAVDCANDMHYRWFYGRLILVNFCSPLLAEQKAEVAEYSRSFISAPFGAGKWPAKEIWKLVQ